MILTQFQLSLWELFNWYKWLKRSKKMRIMTWLQIPNTDHFPDPPRGKHPSLSPAGGAPRGDLLLVSPLRTFSVSYGIACVSLQISMIPVFMFIWKWFLSKKTCSILIVWHDDRSVPAPHAGLVPRPQADPSLSGLVATPNGSSYVPSDSQLILPGQQFSLPLYLICYFNY